MKAKLNGEVTVFIVDDCKDCFANEVCKFNPNSDGYTSGPCLRTWERAFNNIVENCHSQPTAEGKH
jgi:hypothetical protein